MIAFACSHCGMKLKVQDQFAGRQAKCPTCKQPLAVPMPSATVPYVPPQQIDGAESSLAKAGLSGGVTLDNDPAGRKPTAVAGQKPQRSISDALAQRQKNTQRYVVEGEIARGGMGAVLRAVDCDIRREVAVKYMLDDNDPKKKARFIEEAQINGQLEHPNIVPVYDLGLDAQKRPFIMMKLVKGRSLKDVLDQLRDNPKQAEKDCSLGRLLNILVNVCNALAFAHARGVIHRDLKPANIMLGDYGEVYVMDWGLAKVLNQPGAAQPQAVAASVSARNSKVVTNRAAEADLTQEGSVLGTPVYMPPEQATGDLNAIDQRSDVYSLGAILYEMLTLQPPVTKEGGQLGVLMQVVQGEIIPPQQREPKRTRAGKVPTELAAVAMKALAKEKENRYPTADALRQDIERFQEGRSVSAKEDTKREMLWKFVKRNKGFSAGVAAALVVLLCSAWFLFQAWRAAEANYADFKKEQREKQDRTEKAVPALVRAAWFAIDNRDYQNAAEQVDLALTYAPDDAAALLMRGQLMIVRQDFAGAPNELARYSRLKPTDAEAKQLAELCARPHPDDEATSLAFAAVFNKQEAYGLIDGVLARWGATSAEARNQLLAKYRKQIDKHWAGQGGRLTIGAAGLQLNGYEFPAASLDLLRGMPLTTLDLTNSRQIQDLSPLKGMLLTSLKLEWCEQVSDLSPLKGMPLTYLHVHSPHIQDLTILKGMPLTSLKLECNVRDLSPLKGMLLTSLDVVKCDHVQDLTPLEGMPLSEILLIPKNIKKGIEVLRRMKGLKVVAVEWTRKKMPAEEFWKRYDSGEFK